jgi:hypothetical protein
MLRARYTLPAVLHRGGKHHLGIFHYLPYSFVGYDVANFGLQRATTPANRAAA